MCIRNPGDSRFNTRISIDRRTPILAAGTRLAFPSVCHQVLGDHPIHETMTEQWLRLVLAGRGASGLFPRSQSAAFFKPAVITVPRHGVGDCQLECPETQSKLLFTLAVVETGAVLLSNQ